MIHDDFYVSEMRDEGSFKPKGRNTEGEPIPMYDVFYLGRTSTR